MAYENRNAAYDLSLFDQASAAPLPKRDEEVEKVKEPTIWNFSELLILHIRV